MTPRKAALIISLSLTSAIVLLGMLAGFVPQTEGPEVRRKVGTHVAGLRPEDLPAPIETLRDGERLWALRGPVPSPEAVRALQALPDGQKNGAGSIPSAGVTPREGTGIISFAASGVRLELDGDKLLFGLGAAPSDLAPLLALDGVNVPQLLIVQPESYGDALDARGRPLRWLSDRSLLAAYAPLSPRSFFALSEAKASGDDLFGQEGYFQGGPLMERARRYQQLVESSAQRYNLSPELIYAIIHSESSFSPTLVSPKSAMGLMQILPTTAGGEVHRYLYGRRGEVSFSDLSDPEVNIRYGTAYLHILLTRYFSGVRDPLAREYCVVAAYNMGPNRFLRIYGKTGEEAVERINAMTVEELYEDLTVRLPVRETRFYVAKVRRMKDQYAELR